MTKSIERHPVKLKERHDVKSVINRLSDLSFLIKVSVHDDEGVANFLEHFLVYRLFARFPDLF
jgi:cob(I)alamin adenosyltransferase